MADETAQPRGDLDETRRDLERLLRENRSTGRLEKWGV